MKTLSSNSELYKYLQSFSTELKQRGLTKLSEIVDFASAQASSGLPTEFHGESRIALRQVLSEENGALTAQERSDLLDVLKQLDEALNGR